MEYIDPLPDCDRILSLFKGRSSVERSEMFPDFKTNSHLWPNVNNAITRLTEDALIKQSSTSHYMLGGKAPEFIANGGYKQMLIDLKLKMEREEAKENSASTITVLTIDNLKLQNTVLMLQKKEFKRKVVFGVLGFIGGAIVTNIKDILEWLAQLGK